MLDHATTTRAATPHDADTIGRLAASPPAEMSYARGPTEIPLLRETIGENLRATSERFAEQEALVVPHQRYRATYRELWQQVDLAARAFIAHGVRKGDRVGVWAANRYEWVITQFATARIGAILVTINPAYKAAEAHFALRKAGVSMLVMARGFRHTDYVEVLAEVRDGCPALREAIVLEDDWETFLADGHNIAADALNEREATLQPEDPINIQYTSGTTGAPKGATLTHRGLLNNGFFAGQICGYSEDDRICLPVPYYHCFGMVLGNLAVISVGATVVLPAAAFDAAATLVAVQDERCTSLYGVPTMFYSELALPEFADYDLSSLRTGIIAGAPCPVELMHRINNDMGLTEMTIAYGMTETSPLSTQTRRDDSLYRRTATVGTVHPHVEIKVIDPATGNIVPRGTAGEQCTRGYNVMLGYWDDPDASRNAIDADGWMHTGDLAMMDNDGYLSIVGRIKDMIIRGGENIYPSEIENVLVEHPDVHIVQVIGVPDEKYGEEVMAWVQANPGAAIDSEGIKNHCRTQLAHYKVPRYVHLMGPDEEFPMTVTGKVQKNELRKRAQNLINS